MKRKMMLLAGTFLALLVGFVGFHLVTGGGLGFHFNKPVTDDHPSVHAPTTLPKGGNWLADQGTGLDIQDRDKDGRIRVRFTCEDWTKQPDNTYRLQKPQVVFFQNSGQQVHLMGREAVVVAEDMGKKPNIKRGKLMGGVQIVYDTSKEVNRLPAAQRLQDLVCIFVDDLSMDTDRLMIYTDSPLKLYSQQFDVLGRGLLIRWNEAPRELSMLRIDEGEKVTVYKVPEDILSPPGGMAASQPASAPASPVASAPKSPAAPAAKHKAKADSRHGELPERQNLYQAEFDGAQQLINVDYGPQKLHNARTLTIEFQWDNARSSPTATTQRTDVATAPAGLRVASSLPASPGLQTTLPASMPVLAATRPMEPPKIKGDPMTITWAGPLQIKPIGHVENPHPKTYKVTGLGENLVLSDTQATAICKKFTYARPEQKGELFGTEKDPAVVTMADGTKLTCGLIQFDRSTEKARLEGPGTIVLRSTQSAISMESIGGLAPSAQPAPASPLATPAPLSPLAAGSAPASPLAASAPASPLAAAPAPAGGNKAAPPEAATYTIAWKNHVNASFELDNSTLSAGGKMREKIKDADFHGDVHLAQESAGSFVNCQDLQVKFAKGVCYDRYPREALADGKVHARMLNADPKKPGTSEVLTQHALITFEEVPLPMPVKADGKKAAKIRLATFKGWNGVSITDTSSGDTIAAQADTIDSNVLQRTAVLVGKPARVSQGADFLVGETIHLDQINQSAAVNGKGMLRFMTKQDFSGNTLKTPQPVEIAWAKKMNYNGVQGFATFVDQVVLDSVTQNQLETGADHMQCQQMDLWFEKASPASGPALAAGAPARTGSQLGMGMERYSKRKIARLLLDRGVQVTSTRQVEDRLLRRLKVVGGKAEYDAKTTELYMPGTGTLLAEDYRPPEPEKKAPADSATAGGAKLERPWQTLFDWKHGMQFSQANRTVLMEGDVTMIHRSGAQMVLKDRIKTLPMPKLGPGRDTSLTCDKMMATFAAPDKARPAAAPAAKPAAKPAEAGDWEVGPRLGALSKFSAQNKVNFKDGPWQVLGDGLLYDKPDNKATVWSDNHNNAYVFYERKDKNESRSWSSPRINIVLKDGDIQSVQTENVRGGGQ